LVKKNTDGWREFEKLAAEIEDFLSPQGAVVTCPDKLIDIDTGEFREVDASIRYMVGSVPIVIILECRLRKSRQGTMWIEQLSSKRASVGAAKCVAISQTPFTKPAIKKAAKLGVELRNLKTLALNDVFQIAPMMSIHYLSSFLSVNLTFREGMGENGKVLPFDDNMNNLIWNKLKFGLEDLVIKYEHKSNKQTIASFLIDLINVLFCNTLEKNEKKFIPKLKEVYIFSFAGECPVDLIVQGKKYRLGGAAFRVKFSTFFDATTKIDAASIYKDNDDIIAAKVNLVIETFSGIENRSFITSPDNSEFATTLDGAMGIQEALPFVGSIRVGSDNRNNIADS